MRWDFKEIFAAKYFKSYSMENFKTGKQINRSSHKILSQQRIQKAKYNKPKKINYINIKH